MGLGTQDAGEAPAIGWERSSRNVNVDPSDPAYPGQAKYTPRRLAVYDAVVLGFKARLVWRWPTPRLVERYRRYL